MQLPARHQRRGVFETVVAAALLMAIPAGALVPGSAALRSSAKAAPIVLEEIPTEIQLDLRTDRSQLLRTRIALRRLAITDPKVAQAVQYAPTEFELLAVDAGETTLTLWPAGKEDTRPLRVRIVVREK